MHHLKGHATASSRSAFTAGRQRARDRQRRPTLKLWSVRTAGNIASHVRRTRDKVMRARHLAHGRDRGLGRRRRRDPALGRQDRRASCARWSTRADVGVAAASLRTASSCSPPAATPAATTIQRIWDVATGRQVARLCQARDNVLGAALSADGRLVATGGGNNQAIHVWDMETGETRRRWPARAARLVDRLSRPTDKRIGLGSEVAQARLASQRLRGPLECSCACPSTAAGLGRPEPLGNDAGRRFPACPDDRSARTRCRTARAAPRLRRHPRHQKDGKVWPSIERDVDHGHGHMGLFVRRPTGRPSIVPAAPTARSPPTISPARAVGQFIGHEGDMWAVAPSPTAAAGVRQRRPDRAPVEPADRAS